MEKPKKRRESGGWVGKVIITEIIGGAGSIFTAMSVNSWYVELVKPPFNPPNWVFGPVWTGLFALMGGAWYRASRAGASLTWWWRQLGLNVAWSGIFFGLRNPRWAAGEILLLWAAVGLTVRDFYKKDKLAGWLLVPYWGWVSFAAILNVAIWILN